MSAINTTLLASVADPAPLLLPLSTNTSAANRTSLFLIVKIRPSLLHFLVGKRLYCVIRSTEPITDVAQYSRYLSDHHYQLVVSTASGNVWLVKLPTDAHTRVPLEVPELTLERSSDQKDSRMVQWFCQVPGAQSIAHMAMQSSKLSLTLIRSLVTPSTLLFSTRGKSDENLQRHQMLELDEMEAEQSTCTLLLIYEAETHWSVFKKLFSDVKQDASVIAILQGDLDGYVRYSLVKYSTQTEACVLIRNGTLVRLNEPVQMIIPFSINAPSTLSSQDFDALLVLGVRGTIGVIDPTCHLTIEALPIELKTLRLGHTVESFVFLRTLHVFVFSSDGSAFACRVPDVLATAQSADSLISTTLQSDCVLSSEKVPFQPGVMRLATHGHEDSLSILFLSGRIMTIDRTALETMVNSVLRLHRKQEEFSINRESVSEFKVRNLVDRIAHVSAKSSALRTQSKQIDHQLKALHAALEMVRLVEAAGIHSVVKWNLRASMIQTGTFLDRQTIQLIYSIRILHSQALVSLENWWLCLTVRVHQNSVTTFSFPLTELLMRGEQSIVLDPDLLAQHDQGIMWVSSSIAFCSSRQKNVNHEYHKVIGIDIKDAQHESNLAFVIPLLQNRRFLFAQLSQPIEEEMPISKVAIHAAFRQNHEPFMPTGRKAVDGKAHTTVLWHGAQWWDALAEYAYSSPQFAKLWSKMAPSDALLLALSPPSRFVVSIPFSSATEDEEEDDENFEKLYFEKMVSFLRQLLDSSDDEFPRLRRSCRTQYGKLWIVLRTISGSQILLRFTPSVNQFQTVDLTIQCSDVADLSAMRALALEVINKWSAESQSDYYRDDRLHEQAVDMDELLEPIATLENIVEVLNSKALLMGQSC